MKILNIDMDNVVADFESHYLALTGATWESENDALTRWSKLAGKEDLFFLDMPAFEGAAQFVKTVEQKARERGYQVQFLTALPSMWSFPNSMKEKSQWVQEKLNSTLPVVFGPYAKDKQLHCKLGDILIDDSTLNCSQWVRAGGIGIIHRSFENSLRQLERHLVQPK